MSKLLEMIGKFCDWLNSLEYPEGMEVVYSILVAITVHLLSNFYNLTRMKYYRKLDEASRKNSIINFIEYAVNGIADQLSEQMQVILNLHFRTVWRDYVNSRFRKHNPPSARQKRLVLDLSEEVQDNGWVEVSAITHLTPRPAELYAKKTRKTFSRDLNQLQDENLFKRLNGKEELSWNPVKFDY